MLGGIEAGGTKFICAVGTGPDDLVKAQFPTTTPDETLAQVIQFFRSNGGRDLEAIGIGSFGPVDLDPASAQYGHITSTPKPGWANFDLVGAVVKGLKVPVGFDTDVNAALLGEWRWGAAQGIANAIYLTIGTGVGGGVMVHGQVVHGLVHPEIGHLRIPHDLAVDPFPGNCPFHKDCLEGLASGPAMEKRWGTKATALPADHRAWELEAHYLAVALANLTLTISPQRILLGGGVMQQPQLFKMIRTEFAYVLNGYVRHPDILDHLDEYIQPPLLGGNAGVVGALFLAAQEAASAEFENILKSHDQGRRG
jgi:fructokinase